MNARILLRTMERLACLLESKGAPAETQEQLVDGLMQDYLDQGTLDLTGKTNAERSATARSAKLDDTGKALLLVRLKAAIKDQKSRVDAFHQKLTEVQNTPVYKITSKNDKIRETGNAKSRLERARNTLKVYEKELAVLTAPPEPPRKRKPKMRAPPGYKPGPGDRPQ
jgi:hypothetical protein